MPLGRRNNLFLAASLCREGRNSLDILPGIPALSRLVTLDLDSCEISPRLRRLYKGKKNSATKGTPQTLIKVGKGATGTEGVRIGIAKLSALPLQTVPLG